MINYIRSFLGKIGVELRRSSPVNLRGKTVHPIEVAYTTGKAGAAPFILMDIPVSRCRTQLWNTLEKNQNPFVKTIVEYSNNKTLNYSSSAIKAYYENYIPKNACEVLRLPDNEALSQIPAYGYILPWDNQDVSEVVKIREKIALSENRQEGKQIGISAGYTDFGPVDAEKGEIELHRMIRIFENIKKQGYLENPYLGDGGIRGYFLTEGNDNWCFVIKAGKHRAYALSALGYQNIPVVVDNNMGIIKRIDDRHFWPQVSCGIFSEKEAHILATNMLQGEKVSQECNQ